METENKAKNYENVIFYHSSDNMKELPNNSAQVIVTSPPYNVGKYYENGYNDRQHYKKYKEMLRDVFDECFRVLKDDGIFFLNIANNAKGQFKSHDIASTATKSGFYLNDTIIWLKTNPIPATGKIFTNRYEYVFLLTKNKFLDKAKFNKLEISNEYVGKVDKWGRARKQEWKDMGNVWTFPVVKQGWFGDDGHCAMYPADLPRLAILCASDEEDLVLDPFMGSGTTAQVARNLNRKYVGYEINEGYKKAIDKKISKRPEYMMKIKSDIEKEISRKKVLQKTLAE